MKGWGKGKQDPSRDSASQLVQRDCMCIRSGCECTRSDVYVMPTVKISAVRCSDCAGNNCPGGE